MLPVSISDRPGLACASTSGLPTDQPTLWSTWASSLLVNVGPFEMSNTTTGLYRSAQSSAETFFSGFIFKDFIYLFLERWREKERERNIDV